MKYTFIAAMFAAGALALTACGEKKKEEAPTSAPTHEMAPVEPAPTHEAAPVESAPTHEMAPVEPAPTEAKP